MSTIRWFGKRYGAPAYSDTPQVATPVGAECGHCSEQIDATDDGWIDSGGTVFHRECFIRLTGSAAHHRRECSCFVPGSTCSDPPGMTKREAARAALDALQEQQRRSAACRHPMCKDGWIACVTQQGLFVNIPTFTPCPFCNPIPRSKDANAHN